MKLKRSEAVSALVNFICAKLFILAPQSFLNIGKNSAPIAVLLHSLTTLIAFFIIYWVMKKRKINDLFSSLSAPIRMIGSILIALYFIVSAGLTMELVIVGVIRTFMPESPSLFIAGFFIAGVLYSANHGLIDNIRLAKVFAPLLSIIVVIGVLLLPYYEFTNFFPLLGENNFYFTSFYGFNFFADMLLFYLIIPHLENQKDAFSVGLTSILISSALCLLVVVEEVLSIPTQVKFFSPFYQMITFMAGSVSAAGVVKMFKLIFLFNIFLFLSTAIAAAMETIKKGFHLKQEERLAPIFTFLMLMVGESQFRNVELTGAYNAVMHIAYIIFPLLPLIFSLAKRRVNR